MVKRDNRKYLYCVKYLSIRELKQVKPKWITDKGSGIKYKSIKVKLPDTNSRTEIEARKSFGEVKICFLNTQQSKTGKLLLVQIQICQNLKFW